MSGLRRLGPGRIFVCPGPVAVLAVAESVVHGLVARHAYDRSLPAAVPLTLTFLFLLPMAVGYRNVAGSEEPRVGVLTPDAGLLMLLAAAVAQGWVAVVFVILWMPVAMLFALLGGALALMVRRACHAAPRIAKRLISPAGSPGAWRQIVRTPR